MRQRGNDPARLASLRPEMREAILKNKPHLRAAVEALLKQSA